MDNEFACTLFNVQHIKKLCFRIELSNNLMCIVGKNSVGKTTLIRAIKNLTSTDTFAKTASPYIFGTDSCVSYEIDGITYDFLYDRTLNTIDTKKIISEKIKKNIHVELPIPHGERFEFFQKLSKIDGDLKTFISLGKYSRPDDLIDFLFKIYKSNRFENLKEIRIKRKPYYFILKEDGFYIREDYLSSGEHFVINLYKIITQKCKLIVIDEIDISLDASAQVNLISELRKFCKSYEVNIVFTTHSLPLIKTLEHTELFYMENNNDDISIKNVSYNHIRSELFYFYGRWDKYILVEDEMLEQYLSYLISSSDTLLFYTYKIIYIGGSGNVVDLMERNKTDNFFSSPENVISILDGDKKTEIKSKENVFCIPFESIEKQLFEHYNKPNRNGLPEVRETYKGQTHGDRIKRLYEDFIRVPYGSKAIMTNTQIFDFLNQKKKNEVNEFRMLLMNFLNKK